MLKICKRKFIFWNKTDGNREGWLKTSGYRHMKGGGLKLLKNRHMIFELFLRDKDHLGFLSS